MAEHFDSAQTWHTVRVHMPSANGIEAGSFEDAILGRDQAEAEANARHNWITGTPSTPAERIDYLGIRDGTEEEEEHPEA